MKKSDANLIDIEPQVEKKEVPPPSPPMNNLLDMDNDPSPAKNYQTSVQPQV